MTAACESTSTLRLLAARICAADGMTGFSINSCADCQELGSAFNVAALHFRYESVSAMARTRTAGVASGVASGGTAGSQVMVRKKLCGVAVEMLCLR